MTTTLSRALFIAIAGAVLSFMFAPAISAAAIEKTDGFVCPVISTDAVLNSPKGGTLGDTGDYTIGGPNVSIPVHATNGDGTGVPAGDHASPGDADYLAIWAS